MKIYLLIIIMLLTLSFFTSSQEYKLVWEDNFDKPVLDETNNWTIEVSGEGGGNNELQYYRRENISIEKHPSGVNCLVINAKRENFGGKVATSGRLVTRGKVSCKYGKIEARIQFPNTANGFWPAFWMLGEDFLKVSSPRCGEMDIVEMGSSNGIVRGTPDRFHTAACHWGETLTSYATNSTAAYNLQNEFHLFTLIWDQTAIKMYLDLDKFPLNAPYLSMNIDGPDVLNNPAHYFNKPYGILLNLAVGGGFTGITGNSNIDQITALPTDGTSAKMYVDYVRIYQKGEAGEQFVGTKIIPETIAPTLLMANRGAVTYNSIELLLNGVDNSGSVDYSITYDGKTINTNGTSGEQKSCVITGLNPSTSYSFTVVAKDASGNVDANYPLSVSATTNNPFSISEKVDFEKYGYDWSETLFANGDCAPVLYSVVDNPDTYGLNISEQCAKYVVNSTASAWAGVWTNDIGQFTFTKDNCIVKLMVNKDVISNFDLKFENKDGSVSFEKKVSNTLMNEWEEITFDFTAYIGKTVSKMIIIPDFPTIRKVGSTNYWDEISFMNKVITNDEVQIADNIILFPNPVHELMQIKADQVIDQVIVRSLTGQTVLTTNKNERETKISLKQLSSGNYIVTVKLVNGKISTHKITKL